MSWLSGTHIANWVRGGKDRPKPEETEKMAIDAVALANRAADNLEKTLWFGILEDMDRSLELLQYQLGLESKILMSKSNSGKKKSVVTEEDRFKLKSLMPMDIWLYDYAKLLFEGKVKKLFNSLQIISGQNFSKRDFLNYFSEMECLQN